MISKTSEPEADIPIVDLTSPNAAQELLDAAVKYGFIFVKHTKDIEMTTEELHGMFNVSRDFFAAPQDVKASTPVHQNRGYVSMNREALDPKLHSRGDSKEAFNLGEFSLSRKAQQPLPEPLVPHEAQIGKFAEDCRALCIRVLRLLARGLEMQEEEWFADRHERKRGESGSVLRMLYYPPLPLAAAESLDTSLDIRAGAHSDYGSVTLLFRLPGQPGLEILTPEGSWAAVPVDPISTDSTGFDAQPHPLPILVNIGDLLSYWTGGLLKSTVHRVVFPVGKQSERYSIAYFCHPLDEAELEEVPSRIVREHVKRNQEDGVLGPKAGAGDGAKKIVTAKDHLVWRLTETYGGAT